MTSQEVSASSNPGTASISTEERERFKTFVRIHYPYHHKRIGSAKSRVRFGMLKGALWTSLFFGAPLGGIVWSATLFFQSHASSFMDSANPIPLLEGIEPAGRVAIIGIFTLCVIIGSISGYLKQQRLSLQIEEDELRLRTEFLLRENLELQLSKTTSTQQFIEKNDVDTIVRSPRRELSLYDRIPEEMQTEFVPPAKAAAPAKTGNFSNSQV